MRSGRVGAAAAAAVTLLTACAAGAGVTWSYNGKSGPNNWASLDVSYEACGSISGQTPIDLRPTPADLPDLHFRYQDEAAEVFNNGHTVEAEVPVESGNAVVIDGVEYKFLEMHFHAPAEHKFRGKTYPVEVHFVNKSEGGTVAVVGVFIEIGKEDNAAWDPSASPTARSKRGSTSTPCFPTTGRPSNTPAASPPRRVAAASAGTSCPRWYSSATGRSLRSRTPTGATTDRSSGPPAGPSRSTPPSTTRTDRSRPLRPRCSNRAVPARTARNTSTRHRACSEPERAAARSGDSFGLGLFRLLGGGFDDGIELDGCQSAESGWAASAVVGAFDPGHDRDPKFGMCCPPLTVKDVLLLE